MNLIDVTALGVGGILIYSAVTDRNPLDVIKQGLQGRVAQSAKDGTATSTNLPPGKQYVDGSGNSPGTHTSNGGFGPGSNVSYTNPPPVYVSV